LVKNHKPKIMKKYMFIFVTISLIAAVKSAKAQTDTTLTGATAKLGQYDALYVLNSGDDNKIKATLRFLSNAMDDRRLKGKLHVELIAFSSGVNVYMKSGKYEKELKALYDKGVVLAECNNTMLAMNISRNDLFPFVVYVPSGNGEIILRHYDGWAVVQPCAF
jgi:intracellular sulfur oxidation DsrE/DsrF family protein